MIRGVGDEDVIASVDGDAPRTGEQHARCEKWWRYVGSRAQRARCAPCERRNAEAHAAVAYRNDAQSVHRWL